MFISDCYIVHRAYLNFQAWEMRHNDYARSEIHKQLFMPLTHLLFDAEESHKLAIWLAKHNLSPKDLTEDDVILNLKVWNKKLSNPIGLAAGFDKNGEAIDGLFDFGFGFVEIGSVTPLPQPGNPKPRMFRLKEDKAVINRYGFNSFGHNEVEDNLMSRVRSFLRKNTIYHTNDEVLNNVNKSLKSGKLLGINLGKNKTSPSESDKDYLDGIRNLGSYADYIVINISSPNTPGLRSLQRKEPMLRLLNDAIKTRNKLENRPPLLVKIAPDLNNEELEDIANVIQESKVDGVIISNTTITRNNLKSEYRTETGGLSGKPLLNLSLETVKKFYKLTNGQVLIVGCGGISNGKDALKFCKAGATLVQVYTALGYDGPGLVNNIKSEVLKELGEKKWQELFESGYTVDVKCNDCEIDDEDNGVNVDNMNIDAPQAKKDNPSTNIFISSNNETQTNLKKKLLKELLNSNKTKKRVREEKPTVDCEVCKFKLGTGGVRKGIINENLNTSPTISTTGFFNLDQNFWEEPSFNVEVVCLKCVDKYLFCSECGGGGNKRTGKWRPKQMFQSKRKTCSLPHIRI
ncbi:Dihydroorotate dehydrogenase (quinone), mitochondrial, partial [Clydaea vesicula]